MRNVQPSSSDVGSLIRCNLAVVKRLQIMIEEELDEALARRSLDEGVSKAALIRRFVRQSIAPMPALDEDPLSGMIGVDDVDPAAVDDVVYR